MCCASMDMVVSLCHCDAMFLPVTMRGILFHHTMFDDALLSTLFFTVTVGGWGVGGLCSVLCVSGHGRVALHLRCNVSSRNDARSFISPYRV